MVLLKSGFTIRTLKTKYNGKLRYVVYQNLTRAVENLEKNERVSVRLTDVERQKELFHRGFIGVQLRQIDGSRPQRPTDHANGFEVIFSAPSPAEFSFGQPPDIPPSTSVFLSVVRSVGKYCETTFPTNALAGSSYWISEKALKIGPARRYRLGRSLAFGREALIRRVSTQPRWI